MSIRKLYIVILSTSLRSGQAQRRISQKTGRQEILRRLAIGETPQNDKRKGMFFFDAVHWLTFH